MNTLDILNETQLRYPRERLGDEQLEAYVADLVDIEPAALALICRQLWRTRDYFPTVAQIRNAYIDAVLPDDANASYRWVTAAMNSGDYSPHTGRAAMPTEWPDLLTEETVQSVGWPMLYLLDEFQRRKVYTAEYKAIRDARIAAAARGSMLDLGVVAIGEGDGLTVRRIDQPKIEVLSIGASGPPKFGTVPLVCDDDLAATFAGCMVCGALLGTPHRVNCELAVQQ